MKFKKRKELGKFRRMLNDVMLAVLIFHGGTHAVYEYNRLHQRLNPTKESVQFKKQFGFPYITWNGSISGNDRSELTAVVAKEKREKDFDLASIRLRNNNYLKQPLWDQLYQLFMPNEGYYSMNRIVLDEKYGTIEGTIHHEIKHAKAAEIEEKYPEFIEKWKKLAIDENGESMYLSNLEYFLQKFNLLRFINDKKEIKYSELVELGFVSNYARRNIDEDIAELCMEAEITPNNFSKWLSNDKEKRNPLIASKVALAVEYNLLPKEFKEFIEINNSYNKILPKRIKPTRNFNETKPGSHRFLQDSKKFLEKHPESVYENRVRYMRGDILNSDFNNSSNKTNAIKEYKAALASEYKEFEYYFNSLLSLFRLYSSNLNDKKTSRIFSNAVKLYIKRHEQGDVLLPTRGVNDFLKKQGIKLE